MSNGSKKPSTFTGEKLVETIVDDLVELVTTGEADMTSPQHVYDDVKRIVEHAWSDRTAAHSMPAQELEAVQAVTKTRDAAVERQYEKATDFFHSTPAVLSADVAAPSTPSYASGEGSVQFQLIGVQPTDPKYGTIMNENANNLLGMGGLIYEYLHRTYPTVNSQKLDINTWQNVVSNLPCLSIGQSTSKTYTNSIKGVSISGEFLSMIASALITDGGSLLVDFSKYLNGIGDVVFSLKVTGETYQILACTYQNYLVDNGAGAYFDYGAIVLRQIEFTENFMELKAACVKAESVQVDMKYTEIVNLVQTANIRKGGPDYKKFQGLLNANSTEAFKKAKNFFNAPNTPQKDLNPKV